MDVLLDVLDTIVLDRVYASLLPESTTTKLAAKEHGALHNRHVQVYFPLQPSPWADSSLWKRDDVLRQTTSFFAIMWVFGLTMYFIGSTIMYHTIFDKTLLQHPKFLKKQIQLEIKQAVIAMPIMAILTAPFFVAETRGWTKLYDFADSAPFRWYTFLQYPFFIAFTDTGIYWIHRWLHYPSIYRWLHKPHHKWILPTPFASYAFHPVDGWFQSLPYHLFPFVFPLQKCAYLGLFVFVTLWTILIHDAEYLSNSEVINGPPCHTMHHLYFNYNYGQFTTFWDRLGGTYRKPYGDDLVIYQKKET